MPTKQYKVEIYYSTYNTHFIEAESEDEAVLKAREEAVNKNELMDNLDHWEEADVAKTEENYEESTS